MALENCIDQAAQAIQKAEALLITAGAGMGVDSGLPDFRGNEGFWKAYPPMARLGISFQEMANPGWFTHKPRLAWGFYGHRLNLYRKTVPHAGFKQLLRLGQSKPGKYFVFTSNVDGQFQKAGYSPTRIEECHGSIHHFQCAGPCCKRIWPSEGVDVSVDNESFEASGPLPACPHCHGLARPNILMFGDWNWLGDRSRLQAERLADWIRRVDERNWQLVVIEVGAGTAVPTVRQTSELLARRVNGTLIRINPREPQVPPGHWSLQMGAAEGIQQLAEACGLELG